MFAKTLDNFQHSMCLIPESWRCTLHSNHESLRTRRHKMFLSECTLSIKFHLLSLNGICSCILWFLEHI
jgi:hypothetical protein